MGMIEEHLSAGPHTSGVVGKNLPGYSRELKDNRLIAKAAERNRLWEEADAQIPDAVTNKQLRAARRKADNHAKLSSKYAQQAGLVGPNEGWGHHQARMDRIAWAAADS